MSKKDKQRLDWLDSKSGSITWRGGYSYHTYFGGEFKARQIIDEAMRAEEKAKRNVHRWLTRRAA